MFGYVRTHTPEMKVSEYEYYRAAYCGLCRSMGKCTGQCSRMTLSYDFAFLALVRLALSGEAVEIKRRRCVAHPLRKRAMMERNSELDFCAYAAALLTYHKLADDIADERGAKRALARMTRPMARSMRKKRKSADVSVRWTSIYRTALQGFLSLKNQSNRALMSPHISLESCSRGSLQRALRAVSER